MKPVLYRPGSKTPLATAFALAAAIHVSALAFAPLREPAEIDTPEAIMEVDGVDSMPPDPMPEPPPLAETPLPAPLDQPNEFIDAVEPSPRQLPRAVKPIRATRAASAQNTPGYGKLFAIKAPRPAYPYEARRYHVTGSGVALLEVDTRSGSVLTARIVQSTGSSILDNSAVSGFQRWRFRSGSPSRIKIPFTFTMYGAQL